jgi:hypothetical protein
MAGDSAKGAERHVEHGEGRSGFRHMGMLGMKAIQTQLKLPIAASEANSRHRLAIIFGANHQVRRKFKYVIAGF